jgi:hypothetical protein
MRKTLILLTLAVSSAASAQRVASFSDIGRRVSLDDRILVEDRSGAMAKGRVTIITADAITLDTPSGEHRFASESVLSVAKRRAWGGRGALIGAVGFTVYEMIDCHRANQNCADWPLAPLVGAAGGAIIGKLVRTTTVIYSAVRSGLSSSPRP